MHLLAAEDGRIDDGGAAIDLGQSPGEIVVLSAADSELATLAVAAKARNLSGLRLANLMRLGHPLSVDLYLERTVADARLVVVRMMGGAGYWPYGLERLRALASGGGAKLVVVPGEDRWDGGLESHSTIAVEDGRKLWRYFVEGGVDNLGLALDFMEHLLGRGEAPAEPVPMPAAGCYWPGEGLVGLDRVRALVGTGRPIAPIVFYRSILQGALTAPIDALVEGARRRWHHGAADLRHQPQEPRIGGIPRRGLRRVSAGDRPQHDRLRGVADQCRECRDGPRPAGAPGPPGRSSPARARRRGRRASAVSTRAT